MVQISGGRVATKLSRSWSA